MTVVGVGLVAATMLHLGFQLTVTVLVYPALAEVAPHDWERAHRLHSRRVVPLVAVTYGCLAVACAASLVMGPRDGWLAVAGAGALVSVATTAVAAAPLHGRLTSGTTVALLQRLRRVDAVRTGGAFVAVVGAVGWVFTHR